MGNDRVAILVKRTALGESLEEQVTGSLTPEEYEQMLTLLKKLLESS